jgi:L-alanine-DL-glutamate epimerase-like enolase superfamily enzyme
MSEVLREVILRKVRLPLIRPYRLSYRTFTEFEPILVQVRSSQGLEGWGEGHISPGSSSETREGGWRFCHAMAERIIGKPLGEARQMISASMAASKVAATAMITAIEMMETDAALDFDCAMEFPLVAAFSATDHHHIGDEVETLLAQGFRTFKVKVGNDVKADLARVGTIQAAAAGRAVLRIDANRGYSESDGIHFASSLDASGIELFEQPCAAEDWNANAQVAELSTVPLMLDEPICEIADIERAGEIRGVGFCKLKLKRFGGLQHLREALARVRGCGMEPVLGDGLSSEINCWMEACASVGLVSKAGEFNGFLKPSVRLFANPLPFEFGGLRLPAHYRPEIDRDVLKAHEIAFERFSA